VVSYQESFKKWKAHLSTYHLVRKSNIYNKKHNKLATHPIIEELQNHTHVHIPPPTIHGSNQQEWIKTLANIAKTANIQAHKITTQYTQNCIKKAISKYRKLYEKSPK